MVIHTWESCWKPTSAIRKQDSKKSCKPEYPLGDALNTHFVWLALCLVMAKLSTFIRSAGCTNLPQIEQLLICWLMLSSNRYIWGMVLSPFIISAPIKSTHCFDPKLKDPIMGSPAKRKYLGPFLFAEATNSTPITIWRLSLLWEWTRSTFSFRSGRPLLRSLSTTSGYY